MESAFIYLIQDGQHFGTNIYKIGKTVQTGGDARQITRFNNYSRGTIPYGLWIVPVCSVGEIEKKIIEAFNQIYILSHGKEWFIGDWFQMKKDIESFCSEYQQRVKPIQVPEYKLPESVCKQPQGNTSMIELIQAADIPMETLSQDIRSSEPTVPFQREFSCNNPNMELTCKRCGYTTNQKGHLIRHLNNKKQCSVLLQDIPCAELIDELGKKYNEKTHDCEFCGKRFNSRSNKSHHKTICKKRHNTHSTTSSVTLLRQEVKELKEQMKYLMTR